MTASRVCGGQARVRGRSAKPDDQRFNRALGTRQPHDERPKRAVGILRRHIAGPLATRTRPVRDRDPARRQ